MKYDILFGLILCLPLIAGCTSEPDYSLIWPMTHDEINSHNRWVTQKQRERVIEPFEGKPIHVTGIGRVEAVPNIAVITGLIEAKSKSDDIAMNEAAEIMNAVQDVLKDKNAELNFLQISSSELRDEDCLKHNSESDIRHNEVIQDNRFNQRIKFDIERGINTKSKPRDPKSRLSQKLCPVLDIKASVGFVVRISPADSAADTIKILTEAGVEQVNLFGYDFEDYDALYQNAAAKAVSDARTKAELISMRSGTELLDIVEFEVDPPDRTARFGPQAVVVSYHGNRDVNPGQYNSGEWAINSGPNVEYSYVPPVFEIVTETIVVQDASTELVTIPATFETVTETIVVQEAYLGPGGRTIPPVTKQVHRRVVKTPASTTERTIPSVTKQETRRVLKQPGRTIERSVPNDNASNALKISLAGPRTISVNAALTYLYKTPIDGTLPELETSK